MGLGSRIRDPGSGKNLFRSWIQGSKRHRILCIKFTSAGDQTRVACVTGGHSTWRAIKTTCTVSSGCYSPDRQGGVKSPPPPKPAPTSWNLHHNTTQQYGPWILLIYIYIKLPIDHWFLSVLPGPDKHSRPHPPKTTAIFEAFTATNKKICCCMIFQITTTTKSKKT